MPPQTYAGPEPNPPFVFPLEPHQGEAATSAQSPADRDRGLQEHPRNRSKPQQLSISPLPPFEFHPSETESLTPPTGSPARSPRNRASVSTHAGGHRRNGSEFIGGNGRLGGQGLLSASPTKGEWALPTPPCARTPPLGNRARHAHRRSGAISSHDVAKIIKPANESKGTSAPTTPSRASAPSEPQCPVGEITGGGDDMMSQTRSSSPPIHRGTASETLPRARVGFSETVEFIPRPLSTISSETSSSLSTILAGHSVTGSITSIVSAGAHSPPPARSGLNIMLEKDPLGPRPHTANPMLSVPKQDLPFAETAVSPERASSSLAAERPPAAGRGSTADIQPHESTSSISKPFLQDADHTQRPTQGGNREPSEPETLRLFPGSSIATGSTRPRKSPERKVVKRQRKVKSWAGSILSRKPGRRETNDQRITRRSPTPPPSKLSQEDEFSLDDINFDEDTTCVIRTPSDDGSKPPMTSNQIAAWKPREWSTASESDGSAAVLDLDLMIGTANATDSGADGDEPGSRGFLVARRRMHSSGATGGFSGPGMHYHRRADSLPEMAAVNYHAFGFPSSSSSPVMADVFEEEEDDDKHSGKDEKDIAQEDVKPESVMARDLGDQMGEIACTQSNHSLATGVEKSGEGDQPLPTAQVGPERLNSSPRTEVVPGEYGAVEIVNPDDEPRAFSAANATTKPTNSPFFPVDPFHNRPASAPIDFAIRRPGLTFATPESSCISSPDFSRTSFDTPRMHTATSSITDRVTLGSCRTGETGPSIRGSVDDVPSLTSSASMLSGRASRFSRHRGNRIELDRPPSLSAEADHAYHGTAGKRSSLASLSRLVGSSYGEKSKLHIEEHVQPDTAEKTEKKKGNRISRMMRFWKSKEKLSSS